MTDPRRIIEIDYTNWRGERRSRHVVPTGISLENNEWHPETQWMLEAVDCEDGKAKTFPLAQIHGTINAPTLRAKAALAEDAGDE
jgi:predicted DNA-binding transcriptional regulator YafY